MKIVTNNCPREVIDAYQLTEEERKEFDYLDWKAIDRCEDSRDFIRYKGNLLDLGDFITITPGPWNRGLPEEFSKWDGYSSDSFFSGILIRWAENDIGEIDFDRVVVGRYFN